jgi:hypothetical protein
MKIIAHTKYGVFEGVEKEYSEEKYYEIGKFLEKLCDLKYFSFQTDKGEIYLTKEMIDDSLFILEK